MYDYLAELPRRTGGPEVETVRADFTALLARKREIVATKWRADGVPESRVDRALDLLHPTGNPYVDLCMAKGRFPSIAAQFCTEHLKRGPLEAAADAEMAAGRDVVSWQSVRRDESRRRMALPRAQRVRRNGRRLTIFRPILHWSLNAVWWMHDRHGLPRNPLYDAGAERVGCWPCIHARKEEIRLIATRDPAAFDRLAEMEALVADASKWGLATFFAADTTPEGASLAVGVKAQARRDTAGMSGKERDAAIRRRVSELSLEVDWPKARDVAEWSRTSRGGRQYDMLRNLEDEQGACMAGLCE